MVFTNVTQSVAHPAQVLEINFSTPSVSLDSTSWVQFGVPFKRLNGFKQYVYLPDSPTILYGTSQKHVFGFPTISALQWDVTDFSDTVFSLKLYDTGDEWIHVAPTRILPTLTATDHYNLDGTIRASEWYSLTSVDGIDDTLDLFLSAGGSTSISALSFSAGPLHLKKDVSNDQYLAFGAAQDTFAGTFPHKIIDITFTISVDISSEIVEYRVVPTLGNPTVLEAFPNGGYTGIWQVGVVSGTMNYETGDWTLDVNSGGVAEDGTYLQVAYVAQLDSPANTTVTGVTPIFTLSSDQPIYLYDMDFEVAGTYGFGIFFDAYATISGNYTDIANLSPKMRDAYQELEYNLHPAHSNWRFDAPDEEGLSAIDSYGNVYTPGDWVAGDNYPLSFATNGDFFGQFDGTVEVSSTNGLTLNYPVEMFVNSGFANIGLSTSSCFENDFGLAVTSDLILSAGSMIYFDYFPIFSGMQLVTCNGTEILPLVGYPIEDVECLSALGLGLGILTLSLTSGEHGLSGVEEIQSKFPLSAYTLKLFAEINPISSCRITPQYILSAYFEKDNDGCCPINI